MGVTTDLVRDHWKVCLKAYRRGLLTAAELKEMAGITSIFELADIAAELDAELEDSRDDIETRAKPQEVQ